MTRSISERLVVRKMEEIIIPYAIAALGAVYSGVIPLINKLS